MKLIGDEVMYTADDIVTAVDIGLELMDRLAGGPHPLELHCGVAHGPTITVGGDVFGPTVNLASRLTTVARKGKIVVPRTSVAAFEERPDLAVQRVRRVYDLKGIGRTRVAIVSRVDPVPVDPESDPDPTPPAADGGDAAPDGNSKASSRSRRSQS